MNREFGVWGENVACELLVAKGYAIVARNAKVGRVEIDIVAERGNRVVMVEVKTRKTADEDPSFGIDRRKIARLARAAETYVRMMRLPHEVQIDLIFVIGTPHDGYRTEHYEDAFLPQWRSVAGRR